MNKLSPKLAWAALATATGCFTDKQFDDSDGQMASSSATTDATETGASGEPESTSSATEFGATEGETERGTSSGEAGVDTGATDGVDACGAGEPAGSIGLVFDIGTYPWQTLDPEVGDQHRADDVSCTVASVQTDEATVRTELACRDTDDRDHNIVIEYAASELGEPAWTTNEAVNLSVKHEVHSDLSDIPLVQLSLRTIDGRLLLAAVDATFLNEFVDGDAIDPLVVSLDADGCGFPGGGDQSSGLLTLTLGESSIEVGDGRSALWPVDQDAYAVEVRRAVSGDLGEANLALEFLVFATERP